MQREFFSQTRVKGGVWLLFFLLFLPLSAAPPTPYYIGANGKMDAALKTALHEIISQATMLKYGAGAGKTWSGFVYTDLNPLDSTVWDMYSLNKYRFNGVKGVKEMNIEHTLPKSWWGGIQNNAYKDLHHLNPSDGKANRAKSNYPIGIVTGEVYFDNQAIKVGLCYVANQDTPIKVWEPCDVYKGDFARILMYMVTCYEDFDVLWEKQALLQLVPNRYPVFQPWTIKILLAWSRQDPVSEKELRRNEAVFKIQGNRNPFIDYPQLAEYIWGDSIHKRYFFSSLWQAVGS